MKSILGFLFIVLLQVSVYAGNVCLRTGAVRVALENLSHKSCDRITPADLSRITVLDLEGKAIASLNEEDFQGLNSLEELSLDNNQISTLPESIFQGLPNLKDLYIGGNQIQTLPAGIFQNLNSLEVLAANDSQITSLPAVIFQKLPSLKFLLLQNNSITYLPDGIFQGMSTALKEVNLSNNKIASINEHVFSTPSSPSMALIFLINNPLDDTTINILINQLSDRFIY